MTVEIARIVADEAFQLMPELVEILRDVVDGGASIGFLPPLSHQEAEAYWSEIIELVRKPNRILLLARNNGAVAGTVQLNLESRANGKHRAEVMKLIVHSAYRRRGIAQALMTAIESEARQSNRTTLVLDTRVGDHAEKLYSKLGWKAAGMIPKYAANADGTIDAALIMYKLLD